MPKSNLKDNLTCSYIENIEESIENLDLEGGSDGSDEYRTEWEVISEPDDSGE